MPELSDILEQSEAYINYMSSDRIPFPKSLQIELTSHCNLKCIMCPRTLNANRSEPNKHMSTEVLDYIVTSILPYVQRVDVVGDGEPLLAPDLLFHLLDNANLFRVPVTICSNGILLDEKMAQKLIDLNLEDLNISIDAARKETYAKIRGADFEMLLSNIETLNQLKSKAGTNLPHLHFSMVAMDDNIEELPELYALARKMGAESLTVQAMGEDSEEMKGKSAFIHQRDKAEEILYRCLIEAEMDKFPLKCWPDQLMDVMSSLDDLGLFMAGQVPPPGDPSLWRKNCNFLWESPFITTNGDMRPCCANLPPMGNLKQDSFQNIWYSPAYAALRRNLLSGDLPFACKNCPGMGWRKIIRPKSGLSAEDTALDNFPGWYGVELEERYYRWSREQAILFLKRRQEDQFLLFQLRKSGFKDAPGSGYILLNDKNRYPFQLNSTNWETFEIPLPEYSGDELISVGINLTHAVRPAELDENSRDSREIGIKFARCWLESWPQKVVFGQHLILLGYEIEPKSLVMGGDAIFRTYWRSLETSPDNLKVFLHLTRETEKGPASTPLKRKLGLTRNDFFQADHLLLLNGQPSSMWVPGTFIAHEHRISIPENVNPGHYRMELGLYPEGKPKDRIVIARSDRSFQKDNALLGTVLISEH